MSWTRVVWTVSGLVVLALLSGVSHAAPPTRPSVPDYTADAKPSIFVKSATVVRLEGSGVARVRRLQGTEATVAVGATLNPGDRLTTDAGATVELLLGDGTLLRVAPNSEYLYESVSREKSSGLASWTFGLVKGGVRAVVEKGKTKNFVKFKINSPVGTMGVRGTHFLFLHDDARGTSLLYVLEGDVVFGARDADYGAISSFRVVRGGFFSRISTGDRMPTDPQAFSLEDLVALVRDAARASQEGGAVRGGVASGGMSPGILAGLDELLLGSAADPAAADALVSASAEELLRRIEEARKLFEKAQGLLSKNQLSQLELAELGLAHADLGKLAAEIDKEIDWLGSAEARSRMRGEMGERARRAVEKLRGKGVTMASLRAMREALRAQAERMSARFAELQRPGGLDTGQWANLNALGSSVAASYSAGQEADRNWQRFATRHRRCTEQVCRMEGQCRRFLFIRYDCHNVRVCRDVAVPCPTPPPIVGAPPDLATYASPGGGQAQNDHGGGNDGPTGTRAGPPPAAAAKKKGCTRFEPCSTPRCTGGRFVEESDPAKCAVGGVNLHNRGGSR